MEFIVGFAVLILIVLGIVALFPQDQKTTTKNKLTIPAKEEYEAYFYLEQAYETFTIFQIHNTKNKTYYDIEEVYKKSDKEFFVFTKVEINEEIIIKQTPIFRYNTKLNNNYIMKTLNEEKFLEATKGFLFSKRSNNSNSDDNIIKNKIQEEQPKIDMNKIYQDICTIIEDKFQNEVKKQVKIQVQEQMQKYKDDQTQDFNNNFIFDYNDDEEEEETKQTTKIKFNNKIQ